MEHSEVEKYLQEQKRLAEAAERGPWEARHRRSLDWLSETQGDDTHQPGSGVAVTGAADVHISSLWPNRNASANAEFVAAARSSVPKLIAALEAVLALLSSEEAFLDHQEEMVQGAQRRAIGIGRVRAAIEAALGGESDA